MSLPDHIQTAIDTYVPQLGDWLELTQAYQMADLILREKPDVVVELGTFKGQSFVTQAFAIRENNKGKIYGIDPWSAESAVEGENDPANDEWWSKSISLDEIHNDLMKQVRLHHLERWAVVIRSPSQFCFELFPHNIDILYIDANHSELCSCRDVENYAPRVKSGGWIWADDMHWPTTQKAKARLDHFCDLIDDYGNYRLYRKR